MSTSENDPIDPLDAAYRPLYRATTQAIRSYQQARGLRGAPAAVAGILARVITDLARAGTGSPRKGDAEIAAEAGGAEADVRELRAYLYRALRDLPGDTTT